MSGVSITMQVRDAEVRRGFRQLERRMVNTTPVMAAIGTGLVGSTHMRFVTPDRSGRPGMGRAQFGLRGWQEKLAHPHREWPASRQHQRPTGQ
jgi:hypothetical protein